MNRFILFSSLLVSSLFSLGTLHQRISVLEEKMGEVRMQTVYGNYGPKTASAMQNLDSFGVTVWLDAVVYKAMSPITDYAFTDTDPSAAVVGSLNNLDFSFAPGFKVGAKYALCNPDWQLWSEYTWFRTNQSDTTNAVFNAFRKKIRYDMVDLDLGRAYFLRRHFSVYPRFGIRGGWIYQSQTHTDNRDPNVVTKIKNNFKGIGILGGSKQFWNLDANWSFFGDLGASLLYGKVDVFYDRNATTSQDLFDADTYQLFPNMSCEAGLKWERAFFCNRTNFSLAVSYEFNYWWRINQQLILRNGNPFFLDRASEDFGLQGVRINGSLDF